MVWRRVVSSAATVRHGNLIVHVRDIKSLGAVFAELANATPQVAPTCSFYGSPPHLYQQLAGYSGPLVMASSSILPPTCSSQLSDASSQMLNILNGKYGFPFDCIRPAMLACRHRLSAASVTYINGLNDSYKFCRHFSAVKARHMNNQVMLELNHHSTFLASGFSTRPPGARQRAFPLVPPGVFVRPVPHDYVDPEVLSWVLAADVLDTVTNTPLPKSPTSPMLPPGQWCSVVDMDPGLDYDPLLDEQWERISLVGFGLPRSSHLVVPLAWEAPLPSVPSFPALSAIAPSTVAAEIPTTALEPPKLVRHRCDYRKHQWRTFCFCSELDKYCHVHRSYPVCEECGSDFCDTFDVAGRPTTSCIFHPDAAGVRATSSLDEPKASPSSSPHGEALNPTRLAGHCLCTDDDNELEHDDDFNNPVAREYDPLDPRRPENGHKLDCRCAVCTAIDDAIEWVRF